MKKRLAVVFACLLSFAMGICLCIIIPKGQASTSSSMELDRSTTLKYPLDKYDSYKPKVIIEATGDSRFYHRTTLCSFKNPNTEPIIMHTYEAVERGFEPCPDCINELVEIYDYSFYHKNQ